MWTCKFLDPRWHCAASSISISWDVALNMEGRFEGAILAGAVSAHDRYREEKRKSCWFWNATLV